MNPINMNKVIGAIRYRTETSLLIAHDNYHDGSSFERSGRNTFLFRTMSGKYFVQRQTLWQGERDVLEPLSQEQAIELYEQLQEQPVEFEQAFPGVEITEA